MLPYLENTYLKSAGQYKETDIYHLEGGQFGNNYYIISNKGTRHLLASPEVIGFDSYLAMCGATSDMLGWLKQQNAVGDSADIISLDRKSVV